MTNEQLKRKLEKEISKTEFKIRNFRLYNVQAFCKKALLRSGYAIKKVAPYVLASYLIISTPMFNPNRPFIKETSYKGINAITMEASNGYCEKYTSFDYEYKTREIQYSTAWAKDEDGFYSRLVTTFSLPENFREEHSNEEIFDMSLEELQQLITNSTSKKITKAHLEDEDFLYKEPAIVIFDSFESNEQQKPVEESGIANVFHTLFYFLLTGAGGLAIDYSSNLILKRRVENKIKQLIVKNKYITKKELKYLRERLAIKKENMALLNTNASVPGERRVLRRGGSR